MNFSSIQGSLYVNDSYHLTLAGGDQTWYPGPANSPCVFPGGALVVVEIDYVQLFFQMANVSVYGGLNMDLHIGIYDVTSGPAIPYTVGNCLFGYFGEVAPPQAPLISAVAYTDILASPGYPFSGRSNQPNLNGPVLMKATMPNPGSAYKYQIGARFELHSGVGPGSVDISYRLKGQCWAANL